MARVDVVKDLTLALLFLNSWTERTFVDSDGEEHKIRRAWKGADWDALDALEQEGYLSFSHKAKSVYITDEGMREAKRLIEKLGLETRLEAPALKVPVLESATAIQGLVPAFTFSLRLRDVECERILRVPQSFSFEDFHTAIQACLNWLNYHLFDIQYVSHGKKCKVSWPDFETGGNPDDEFAFMMGSKSRPEWADAAQVRLSDIFPRTRKALYSYDYGDGWEFDIRLLDAKTPLKDSKPCCLGGSGNHPPEDVGGPGGFEEFMEIIANPDYEEHDEYLAWCEGQGYEDFDINVVNDRLSHYDDWRAKGVYRK